MHTLESITHTTVRTTTRNRLLAVAALLLAACGGPIGPPGQDGAAGEKGDPGATGGVGSVGPAGPVKPPRLLDDKVGLWIPRNRDRLNKLLADKGIASPTFDARNRPVAVFDWDNTVIKNDIGDGTFFYLLRRDKIRQPANKDWGTTNANLTVDAKAALNAACDALVAAGDPLPTSTNAACADAIFHIYYNGKTSPPAALKAWNNEITLTINNPYAWVAQLLAGYTPAEVRSFADAAYEQNATAPIGTTQTVGTASATGYLRIYGEIRDLIGALHENLFDVWVVSASPQHVVEPVAERVGVSEDRVIGIRSVLVDGKLTADLEGCGTVADKVNTLITYDEGKRCFINKVIYKLPAGDQMKVAPEAKRPVFAAGDSDTDIAFLKDATALKLAINRNKTQLMCNAYANYQDKWLAQPMFIAPRACKTTPFACSAALDAAGNPIVDEAGTRFGDQTDSVCLLPAG